MNVYIRSGSHIHTTRISRVLRSSCTAELNCIAGTAEEEEEEEETGSLMEKHIEPRAWIYD